MNEGSLYWPPTHAAEPLSGAAPEVVVSLIITGLVLLLLLITAIAVLVAVRQERRKRNSKIKPPTSVPLPLYRIPASGSIETTNIVQVQNSTDPLDPVNDRQGTCVSECRQVQNSTDPLDPVNDRQGTCVSECRQVQNSTDPLDPVNDRQGTCVSECRQVQNSTDPLDPVNDRQGTCVSECRQVQKSTCFLQNKKDNPLVLVIYSPNSSEEDKHLVWQYLVCDLAECHNGSRRIQIESYDSSLRKNASAWLEDNFMRASMILCVCNIQFKREWDQQNAPPFCPLIFSLRQLVYAMLNRNTSPSSKFAVVLLRQSDYQHIPEYLNSTKHFLVNEVKEIGRFVYGVPKCVNPDVNGHS